LPESTLGKALGTVNQGRRPGRRKILFIFCIFRISLRECALRTSPSFVSLEYL